MNPTIQSVKTYILYLFGTKSLTSLANKIWSLIPAEIQNTTDIPEEKFFMANR